jgi:hypothetical protein
MPSLAASTSEPSEKARSVMNSDIVNPIPAHYPPEDCLWAKSWKGRTIFSTGRSRPTLILPIMPQQARRTADSYSPGCVEGVFSEDLMQHPA